MTKKELLKAGAKLVVGTGVSCIVSNAVVFTTPVIGVSILKKVCITAGQFVLGAMVSEKAIGYTDKKIDEGIEEVKKMMEEDKEKEETKA